MASRRKSAPPVKIVNGLQDYNQQMEKRGREAARAARSRMTAFERANLSDDDESSDDGLGFLNATEDDTEGPAEPDHTSLMGTPPSSNKRRGRGTSGSSTRPTKKKRKRRRLFREGKRIEMDDSDDEDDDEDLIPEEDVETFTSTFRIALYDPAPAVRAVHLRRVDLQSEGAPEAVGKILTIGLFTVPSSARRVLRVSEGQEDGDLGVDGVAGLWMVATTAHGDPLLRLDPSPEVTLYLLVPGRS